MKSDDGLIRAVGVRGLTASMINYTIGAGIFVLPALIAARVGAAAPAIYIICAVAMGLIVLCFAQAGSRVPLTGGAYAYAGVAFGPYIGFIVAIALWFGSNVLSSGAVANVFMDTLAQIFPAVGAGAPRAAILIAAYALFASINIRGVKVASGMVQGITLAKLAPLIILVALALGTVRPVNLMWPGLPAAGDTARASVMLIFAFLGVESGLTLSGEVRDPARTVPRAVFLNLGLVTLLYLAIQFVAQGVLGPDLAANTKSPLAETARRALGSGGAMLVLVGTAISTFGYVGGDVLSSPRSLFALARDGLMPAPIARVSKRYHTPHVAIIVHASLCAGFAVTGSFASLLVVAALAALIVYLICCLAAIKLRMMNVRIEGAIPFRVPGGPVVPLLASAIVVWLMTSSTRKEFLALAAMVAISTLVYFVMRSRQLDAPAREST